MNFTEHGYVHYSKKGQKKVSDRYRQTSMGGWHRMMVVTKLGVFRFPG